MKLFAILVGGEHPRANIELHDMRFVVAEALAETHDELRRQWWGTPDSLHVDCWAELHHADGHEIELRSEPFVGEEKLFYVNLGGYDGPEFLEKHRNVFVVARTLSEAKARALHAGKGWKDLHRDDLYEAENAYCLDQAVEGTRLYIHVTPSAVPREVAFTCKHTPLTVR